MSGVNLEYDRTKMVIRNIGDPPGTLAFACPDGVATWAVDSAYEPPHIPGMTGTFAHEIGRDSVGIAPTMTALTPAEVVSGIHRHREAQHIVRACQVLLTGSISMYMPTADWQQIRSAIDLVEDTFDELFDAGWISQ